ncbi:MAG: hypothetical protein ACOYOK_09960 [Pseudobdellovibrionaceae bacterium]
MKLDSSKLNTWIQSKETYLPGLGQLLSNSKSNILIIGASVFEFYQIQNWMPPFKRKTGDIDLSIGIIGDSSLYDAGKNILTSIKYTVDKYQPYRFKPPLVMPGGFSYIDLLAHPANKTTRPEVAAQAMGVGPGFSFKAFDFAMTEAFSLTKNVSFPNPFGLIALKQVSYLDEPAKRVKDFADIVELICGLVETGTHFEMDDLWSKVSKKEEAQDIKRMLNSIEKEESKWDIEDIRKELLGRDFNATFIDETLPQRLKDFNETLR